MSLLTYSSLQLKMPFCSRNKQAIFVISENWTEFHPNFPPFGWCGSAIVLQTRILMQTTQQLNKNSPYLCLGQFSYHFQQSLICWQKCLGPLTAKVTESTTHPADSKQGIWGMAFKQWLSHQPFCHPMLWKAYEADDFLPWVTAIWKTSLPPLSPQQPAGLGYSCFICLSGPTAVG